MPEPDPPAASERLDRQGRPLDAGEGAEGTPFALLGYPPGFDAAMRQVGARPVGETTPPVTVEKESRSGWLVVAGKLGLKTLPLGAKFLTAGLKVGLFVASFGAWAFLFDWRIALALLAMVGIHESGHVAAMRYYKVPTSGFYFIPFLGGVAMAKKHPRSHKAWAVIVLAGPFVGASLSLLALAAWWLTGEVMWAGLAILNALLNLVNLLPLYPLDGGQLTKILAGTSSTRAARGFAIASAVLAVGAIFAGFWLFGILGLLSVPALWREAKLRHRVAANEFPGWELSPTDLTERGRIVIGALYVGLAASLIGLISLVQEWTGLQGAGGWL